MEAWQQPASKQAERQHRDLASMNSESAGVEKADGKVEEVGFLSCL